MNSFFTVSSQFKNPLPFKLDKHLNGVSLKLHESVSGVEVNPSSIILGFNSLDGLEDFISRMQDEISALKEKDAKNT